MDIKKRSIILAIMVAMFLGAVEGTVVTTAVPTITRDLTGFDLVSWVFSIYLLTSAISTPIYGKLSDLYGRKNTLSFGILIFLVGSSLCGIAQNMYQLIGFRALQGVGAGAIFTVSYTIIGDAFPLSERAKIQGWLSSVWGIASLAGPFLGGFIIDSLSWHWIFFINIPFGILSIALLQANLRESFERKKHKIDYTGTLALSAAIISLLLGFLAGGKSDKILSPSLLGLLGAGIALLAVFYFIEKKAAEPIFPFEIFTRTNTLANIICFMASAVLIGVDVYLSIYIQNVLGFGATVSGLTLAPMSLSWILSSVILSRTIPKFGERVVTGISALVLLIGCGLLLTLGVGSPLIRVMIFVFIMGFGFGGIFTTLTIVVQASVDFTKRGAATASNSLLRTIGQTIGVSIFGGLLNIGIVRYFDRRGIAGVEPGSLYSRQGINTAFSPRQIHASINDALHSVFIVLFILALACTILSLTLSSGLKESEESEKGESVV
jgi:EmrB/QacA subfamily drug resistance transporter